MAELTEVLKEALVLDARDRAELAEKLLASLDQLTDDEAERLWAGEAQRRREEYQAGRARSIEAGKVAAKVESLLR